MADVLALVDDIFFQAKMRETARTVGLTLQTVESGSALLEKLVSESPALIVVDLNARDFGPGSQNLVVLETLRDRGIPYRVIAFLSHVQVDLAARARAAGCTDVMPRSKFTQELPKIFAAAKASAEQQAQPNARDKK